MKLLLNTQVFIWLINDSEQLGPKTKQLLYDKTNRLYCSYFSFFEMAIKANIGKLAYDNSVLADLPSMGITLLQPSERLLADYTIYNPANKDPFDNMLITVALLEKCKFVTSDQKILTSAVPGLKLLNATQ